MLRSTTCEAISSVSRLAKRQILVAGLVQLRTASTVATQANERSSNNQQADNKEPATNHAAAPKIKKTLAELDEELKAKMAEMAGDGGESGVEYENGVPVAMKRGVKDNMFRYI